MTENSLSRLSRANAVLESWGPWPYMALTLSMLFFASNHILGRLVPGEVPPIGLSLWRWVVATLVILPLTWREIARSYKLILGHWKYFVVMTFCLVVLGNTTIYIALHYTTAINGGMVAMVQPVVTMCIAWVLFRELVTRWQVVGAIIAAAGVMTILTRGDLAVLTGVRFNIGDLWMMSSVIGFSFYAVLLREAPRDISPLAFLNVTQFLGIVILIPFYWWETVNILPTSLNTTTVISVLWAGIIVAVGALGLWNIGNRLIGASKASAFIYVRVLMITGLAMVFLDETLELYHFPAFVLIIGGVYLVSAAKRKKQGA
jgi:drug/metabolite transporter (DMT)-like permease